MVKIKVNGETKELNEPVSIAGLLEILAVELNREIVRKSDYETTVLKEGDSLEIVRFAGGG